jgi:hypothetical protein
MSNDPTITMSERIPEKMRPYSYHQGHCRQPERSNRTTAKRKEQSSSWIGQHFDSCPTETIKDSKQKEPRWKTEYQASQNFM